MRRSLGFIALGVAALSGNVTKGAQTTTPPKAEMRYLDWRDLIDKVVEARQPKPAERRFDEIAWVSDMKAAKALATKHRRPIFLFTMDGRINIGRC